MRLSILPLSERLRKYCVKHRLEKLFEKQRKLFEGDPSHPSLQTELLEPKNLRFYSFRITRQYRAIFIYR